MQYTQEELESLFASSRQFIKMVEIKQNDSINANEYPFNIPAVKSLPLIFTKPVTFFVGANGTGKSTILEAIAVAFGFNPEGRSRNFQFSTFDSHSILSNHLKLTKGKTPDDGWFLRAESFYNASSYLTEINKLDGKAFASYGNLPLHKQSHGESFFALLNNRISSKGLYIFDEPEAALSAEKQLSLLKIIQQLTLKGSQFIISTHSPILSGFPNADILEFSERGIKHINYEDSLNFIIYRSFLNDRQRILHELDI